jgi:predicted transcriptional regulator
LRELSLETDKQEIPNHRGHFDIIADILNASLGGAKKTHLMYHCNLSFRQLKHYSHLLLSRGFLTMARDGGRINSGLFEVTDKGKKFLKAYRGLIALIQ